MNAHLQPAGQHDDIPDLYSEHSAGTHFVMRNDRSSFFFRATNPFLSTGNFDQAIESKDIKSKNFISCGNFQTSTEQEDWGYEPDDFKLQTSHKLANSKLEHSSQNVKYNLNSDSHQKKVSRSLSNEQVEPTEAIGFVEQNIVLTKPTKSESPTILRGEPLYKVASSQVKKTPTTQGQAANFDDMSDIEYNLQTNEGNQFWSKPISRNGLLVNNIEHKELLMAENTWPAKDAKGAPQQTVLRPRAAEVAVNSSYHNDSYYRPETDSHAGRQYGAANSKPQNVVGEHENFLAVFESIREQCMSELLAKKSSKKLEQSSILEEEISPLQGSYSLGELLDMAMYSKETSIQVQLYLREFNKEDLNYAAGFLCQHIDALIFSKFGNYVVQFLVEIHRPTRETVANTTLSQFVQFAENEYGSRIMQKLCTISPEYCFNALNLFYKHFDRLIRNITGSILLSKLISASSQEADYLFAVRVLEHNRDFLRKAYFNRMLSTLVGCCSDATLLEIVGLIKNYIWVLMNDKFGNYVLQILVERAQPQGTNLVKAACLKNSPIILTRKYPKFLLIKIVDLDTDGSFSAEMMQRVMELEDVTLADIISKRDSFMLLMLILCKQPSSLVPMVVGRFTRVIRAYFEDGKPNSWNESQVPDQGILQILQRLKDIVSDHTDARAF